MRSQWPAASTCSHRRHFTEGDKSFTEGDTVSPSNFAEAEEAKACGHRLLFTEEINNRDTHRMENI